MKLHSIRQSFLDFFSKNQHKIIRSSSLIPDNDPSLLFTNAGMVQFKNYFTGASTPKYTRAASSQKCIRAGGKHNDLENVGYTARHHTFFEMLGNFSFNGDYFKEQAIYFAWNYLTNILGLDKSRLYITVYYEDLESYNIWQKMTGFGPEKIIKIATNDNFWSMGDVGPCGPCSEIFFDHGDKYEGGLPGTPTEGGDRYIEIWNLVFMQYEQLPDGTRIPLPKPAIDTGMGLERIAAVMQGVNDNYSTDLFLALRKASEEISGNVNAVVSHKVIADHLRSSCFLIADGVMPSNDGRGYVLRRIMRRAMRHIHGLGVKEAMMYKLVPYLIELMGADYPELSRAASTIESILEAEEERFSETLGRGMKILNNASCHLKQGDILDGNIAFTLYDTYGFPLDLTRDILRANQISIDEVAFEQAMALQKQKAKNAWSGSGDKIEEKIWYDIAALHGETKFIGYDHYLSKSIVLAIIVEGQTVSDAVSGEAIIVTDKTTFYGESGGQVGDIGWIDGNIVLDVKKYANGIFGHHVKLQSSIRVGEEVELIVDKVNREKIMANHSATHLLQKALQEILGPHVTQKGSVVNSERLRFDFSHNAPLTPEIISKIEKRVNAMIIQNDSTKTEMSTPQEAINKGAMALFGEKYGDEVRVVSLGASVELCGGTHVNRTGDIGLFKITNEESIAAGVRRIEALTGLYALEFAENKQNIVRVLIGILKCSEAELEQRVLHLQHDNKSLEKALSSLKAANEADQAEIEVLDNFAFITLNTAIDIQNVKNILEILKRKYTDSVICIISNQTSNTSILISVTGVASTSFKANELLKTFIEQAGGKGGGNANLAQAGSCDINNTKIGLNKIKMLLVQSE